MEMSIRQPAVAGAFYPGDKIELKEMIDGFLAKVPDEKIDGEIKAILVPHAGYIYSGQVAAYAYKLIKGLDKKRIIMLGPSHTTYLDAAVSDDNESWITPFGGVKLAENNFDKIREAHIQEHCLEVQVPFLQSVLEYFEIIPLVAGDADPKKIAEQITRLLDDEKTLLVISTDLSHFHEYDEAKELDTATVKAISKLDASSVGEACGAVPIKTVIEIAKEKKWKVKELCYKNSGDVSGDRSRVVGYTSFVFYEEKK